MAFFNLFDLFDCVALPIFKPNLGARKTQQKNGQHFPLLNTKMYHMKHRCCCCCWIHRHKKNAKQKMDNISPFWLQQCTTWSTAAAAAAAYYIAQDKKWNNCLVKIDIACQFVFIITGDRKFHASGGGVSELEHAIELKHGSVAALAQAHAHGKGPCTVDPYLTW